MRPPLPAKPLRIALLLCLWHGPVPRLPAGPAPVHVWEKQELAFTARGAYANPYADLAVWVDLRGPGYSRRVYGFWDGGRVFRVRILATAPGSWAWTAGSAPEDPGIRGRSGSFAAAPWTEAELAQNPLRRGMVRPSANGHALEYADGTPYLAIGDTWYALASNRFRWYDDEGERPIGPGAGFRDYVRLRRAQGYNWISAIAAFPNWKTDGKPWHLVMDDAARTTVRSAWLEYGTGSAKNMDNEGGRPFLFPGRVPGFEGDFPDMDRINPDYFRYLDRKVDYLNANGFVVFIEASRRDSGLCWHRYYDWPGSYARYVQYVWSRYQANIAVLSPVHLDIIDETVSPADYAAAVRSVEARFGPPPFGTLLSANANPSTLENWGEPSWVTLQQIGNRREHENYWYLTEIYGLTPAVPALNGEPYYAGYRDARGPGSANYTRGAPGGTARDDAFCRSGCYGSFLSGGLAGHVYGAEGIWGADIEAAAPTKMWDAFQWASGAQMPLLKAFALSIGRRYQELVPMADAVSPNRSGDPLGYEGWAYCARTPDRAFFLLYFESGCPKAQVRGARPGGDYRAQWFNARDGTWLDAGGGHLRADKIGAIALPGFPGEGDWGLRLALEAGPGP